MAKRHTDKKYQTMPGYQNYACKFSDGVTRQCIAMDLDQAAILMGKQARNCGIIADLDTLHEVV